MELRKRVPILSRQGESINEDTRACDRSWLRDRDEDCIIRVMFALSARRSPVLTAGFEVSDVLSQ